MFVNIQYVGAKNQYYNLIIFTNRAVRSIVILLIFVLVGLLYRFY